MEDRTGTPGPNEEGLWARTSETLKRIGGKGVPRRRVSGVAGGHEFFILPIQHWNYAGDKL